MADTVQIDVILQAQDSPVQNVLATIIVPLLATLPALPDMPDGATRTLQVDTAALADALFQIAVDIDASSQPAVQPAAE